jgi:hypothetical protein
MIIWSGKGFLVAIIVFVDSLIANLLTNMITNNEQYYDNHSLPVAISLMVSGILCWFLAKYLNKAYEKIYIEKETGKEVTISNSKHALFFINIKYWCPILFVISIIVLFAK